MSELLDVLDAFSTPLKIGWVLWIAWGIGQLWWYRQERTTRAARTAAAPAARAVAPVKTAEPPPRPTRLITPEPVFEPVPEPPPRHVPIFDPSKAVVETFAPANEIDSFVADFERSHQRKHNGDLPSFRP
jgi:hypothetical protein